MEKSKQACLEAQGWKISTVADFLELTPEESTLVEIKLALSKNLHARIAGVDSRLGQERKASDLTIC